MSEFLLWAIYFGYSGGTKVIVRTLFTICVVYIVVMEQHDKAPPEYNFNITEHWNERVVIAHGGETRALVLDRETAVQAVRDLLKNCVPELVLQGHEYPTQETVTVTVADELDFEIDAADVFNEPIEYRELDPLI